jgi:hypothetical protein
MTASKRTLGWSGWRRVLVAWLVLALAMSANGIFRELVLRPVLGARWAAVASAALGIALLLAVSRTLFPRLADCAPRALAVVSAALVALTVAFETVLGLYVDGKSWRALPEHYALWRGELWPIVLATLAITPFLWGRWRPRPARRAV